MPACFRRWSFICTFTILVPNCIPVCRLPPTALSVCFQASRSGVDRTQQVWLFWLMHSLMLISNLLQIRILSGAHLLDSSSAAGGVAAPSKLDSNPQNIYVALTQWLGPRRVGRRRRPAAAAAPPAAVAAPRAAPAAGCSAASNQRPATYKGRKSLRVESPGSSRHWRWNAACSRLLIAVLCQ